MFCDEFGNEMCRLITPLYLDDDLPSGSWIALLVSFESEAPVSLAVLATGICI
jgi:hypothetical protein